MFRRHYQGFWLDLSATVAYNRHIQCDGIVCGRDAIVAEEIYGYANEAVTISSRKRLRRFIPPASMIKFMSAYLVLEGISEGRHALDSHITASEYAAQISSDPKCSGCGSWKKIYLERPGTIFTISGDLEDTEAMLRYLEQSGVTPPHAILRDPLEKNSYASIIGMLRKNRDRPFILLTSSFYLPRCAYIAKAVGADAYPFRISDYETSFSYRYLPRECLAFLKEFWQLKVIPPLPATLSRKDAKRP